MARAFYFTHSCPITHTYVHTYVYTQLSGTRVAINIFLIACTLISKSIVVAAVVRCSVAGAVAVFVVLLQLLLFVKYEPSIKSWDGTFVATDFNSRFFGRFSWPEYLMSYCKREKKSVMRKKIMCTLAAPLYHCSVRRLYSRQQHEMKTREKKNKENLNREGKKALQRKATRSKDRRLFLYFLLFLCEWATKTSGSELGKGIICQCEVKVEATSYVKLSLYYVKNEIWEQQQFASVSNANEPVLLLSLS